jgi:glycosyltransferase involved in cell wall biosynthesis
VILVKIIILTPYYYPTIGGITTFVDNLKIYLSKKNCSVSIISNAGYSNGDTNIMKPSKYLFVLRSYRIIRKEKPDVLHSHSRWNILAPCVIYKLFHPNTVLIHTYHTEFAGKILGIKKKIIEFLLSKCDVVTFVSKDLERRIEENVEINTQKRIIYSGVTEGNVKEDDLNKFVDEYHLNHAKPIISFIGPLAWKMKVEGVKRLIDAFKIMKKTHPSGKLLIVGDGKYRRELEGYVEKNNVADDVIFTGFLDNANIPLSITSIYTHISLQEGFPIALLEAMSMGKPVIATRTGGIPEVIVDGQNGVFVEPEPGEIAKTIIELHEDEERMGSLGKNAQITVKEGHDWDNIAEEFTDLYEGRY